MKVKSDRDSRTLVITDITEAIGIETSDGFRINLYEGPGSEICINVMGYEDPHGNWWRIHKHSEQIEKERR